MSESELQQDLGYDPQSDVTHWNGTPIPPVSHPLTLTPERDAVARHVWWNGDPWTILRNGPRYIQCVMDHGYDKHVRWTLRGVEPRLWQLALEEARPGILSLSSYILWSQVVLNRFPDDAPDWPRSAHRNDIPPLRGFPRESFYERQRLMRCKTKLC